MTVQHPLIPVCAEVNQIIDGTLGKIDAGTAPHIRSIAGAAVETIIRHPRSSEIILWPTSAAWTTASRICVDARLCSSTCRQRARRRGMAQRRTA
jgi:hypothetical protein